MENPTNIVLWEPTGGLEEFVITCRSMEDLESLYDDLETKGGTDAIPDRAVPVYKRRPLSQNTHYMLTVEEANNLLNDPRVTSIEHVKFLNAFIKPNSYTQTGTFSKSPSTDVLDPSYKNWALLRCIEGAQRLGWGSDSTKNQTSTITVGPTGKNVDVIIIDGIGGVPNHPEFAVNPDGTGSSRYKQYDWFQLNSIATGLNTNSDVLLNATYPYTEEAYGADHGTHVAGSVAGNTQGWARDANIYNISPYGDVGAMSGGAVWDYVRAFHSNKPINPETGIKNPTICNCSFGITINLTAVGPNPGIPNGYFLPVRATYAGVDTGYTGAVPYSKLTKSKLTANGLRYYEIAEWAALYGDSAVIPLTYYSPSSEADILAALNDGIIIVASAGNDCQYIDVPTGANYNDQVYFTNLATPTAAADYFYVNSHRGSSPGAVPGVICVGAIDDTASERKASYSNTGPRVDIWAPGTNIISSFLSGTTESRNTNYYIDRLSGTSMASPQVCGVLACLLEIYPRMTPAQALSLITVYAKTAQLNNTTTANPAWTQDLYSLRNANNKYLYMPKERPSNGEMYPKQNHMLRPTSGIMYPRRSVRIR
jgi:hypothetical protein